MIATSWPDVACLAIFAIAFVLVIGFERTDRWPWERK